MNTPRGNLEVAQAAARKTLPSVAARIVSSLLGDEVQSVEFLDKGFMTFKCLVRTRVNERTIVRFYPPRRAYVVNQEPDLLARCRLVCAPVPEVIGDSRTGPPSELTYVAYRMIEGSPLLERLPIATHAQQSRLAADLADLLSKLQCVRFTGAGELTTGSDAREATWKIFVDNSIQNGLRAIREHALLDEATVEDISLIAEQMRRTRSWNQPMHRLVWGDINFQNILVDSHGRVGLIDFESCLSGDPLATLGYCFAAHGPHSFFSHLLDALPEALSAEDRRLIPFYAVLRALRLAPYAHLPLPTGYPRDPIQNIFPGLLPAIEELKHRSL